MDKSVIFICLVSTWISSSKSEYQTKETSDGSCDLSKPVDKVRGKREPQL